MTLLFHSESGEIKFQLKFHSNMLTNGSIKIDGVSLNLIRLLMRMEGMNSPEDTNYL